MKPHQAQIIEYCARAGGRVWVSQQGRGDDLKILIWKGDDDEVIDYCGEVKMEGGE